MRNIRLIQTLLPGILLLMINTTNGAPANEGSWGEWRPWSSCSRSCGTKLSVQERHCSSNLPCVGPRRQFRSCAAELCPEPQNLRAQQCSAYDDSSYTYIPIENGGDQCQLTCIASKSSGVASLIGPLNVTPGASCNTVHGERGVCLDAVCTPIGCDNVLGSKKVLDRCMRCIDPTAVAEKFCVNNSGNVVIQETQKGHTHMFTLPAGASSITVTNLLSPINASLMLRSSSGDVLFMAGTPGTTVVAAGVVFRYGVNVSGENFTESITGSGVLSETVDVEVYISDVASPRISYEYFALETAGIQGNEDNSMQATPSNILWVYEPFSECTENCITGIQVSHAVCKDLDFNRKLPDVFCLPPKPFPILRQCSSGNCAPRWVAGDWQLCSLTLCGAGRQNRIVKCHVLEQDGEDRLVADTRCNAAEKPAEDRHCVVEDTSHCDAKWNVEEWGQCCTSAPLDRRVTCTSTSGSLQPPFMCAHLPRANSTMSCEGGPCDNGGCDWVPKRWFSCKNSLRCGKGVQTRTVRCRNTNNRTAGDNCCRHRTRPLVERECFDSRADSCVPSWHSGLWGKCSGECGESQGVREREVVCHAVDKGLQYIEFPDHYCANETETKPVARENCTRTDASCEACHWKPSKWSECLCPLGVQIRNVTCSSTDENCCIEQSSPAPPEAESCVCPVIVSPSPSLSTPKAVSPSPSLSTPKAVSPSTVASPNRTPCVDNPRVDCQQVLEDGHCATVVTDFFQNLCCATCTSS